MKKVITKDFLVQNRGCYAPEELQACSFMKKDSITLKDIVKSEIPLKDKYWFVCRKLNTIQQNQQLAITCAEIVLPIYEKKHRNNKAPRLAIKAAKDYLKGKITLEELLTARRAAADAYAAAADAAYAADADADAADAADAAADAAAAAAYADAADAAAYAAAADAAAAAGKKYTALLQNALESHCRKYHNK